MSKNIQEFKTIFTKLPYKSLKNKVKIKENEVFEHFKAFIYCLNSIEIFKQGSELKKSKEELIKHKFFSKMLFHYTKLWNYLVDEFMEPGYYYDKKGFNEQLFNKYVRNKSLTIKQVQESLVELQKNNEFNKFFESLPYVNDLLFFETVIDDSILLKKEDIVKYNQIMSGYLNVLSCYDRVIPLLVLQEHFKLIYSDLEFDKSFYEQHLPYEKIKNNFALQVLYLSLFIETSMSYKLKESIGFNKLNWNILSDLYKSIHSSKLEKELAELMKQILPELNDYINQLVKLQFGEINIEHINKAPDLQLIEKIVTKEKLFPAFEIIEYYLAVTETIQNDDINSRLTVLRVITAVGEALKNIKALVPTDQQEIIDMVVYLRDSIIHSTYESYKYTQEIINDTKNQTLPKILVEMKSIKLFINQLKEYLLNEKIINISCELPNFKDCQKAYEQVRKKDDRDTKLSISDFKKLELSIPNINEVDNSNYNLLKDCILEGAKLSSKEFKKYILFTKYAASTKQASKLIEKIVELKKIEKLEEALKNEKLDFEKIDLNVKDKIGLNNIKQEKNVERLKQLLYEHKQKNSFDKNSTLELLKTIDIANYKKVLIEFTKGKYSQKKTEEAVEAVFINDENNKLIWKNIIQKYTGKIQSKKFDQINQVGNLILDIELLRKHADKIFDNKYLQREKDPIIATACEMLYGFCLEGFKNISKGINELYDYEDHTLYFFAYEHPLSKIKNIADSFILQRNNMLHFERVFNKHEKIEFAIEMFMQCIQHLTHGQFYSKGTLITSNEISTQSMFSNPTLIELKNYWKLINSHSNSDSLNVYKMWQEEDNHSLNALCTHSVESYWYSYTKSGIEQLLHLRLAYEKLGEIQIFSPKFAFNDERTATFLSQVISQSFEKCYGTLLVPLNLYNKHWIGLVIEKDVGNIQKIRINYIDPEQQPMPKTLMSAIQKALSNYEEGYEVNIKETVVEQQKYNNCGPEVIENIIAHFTGKRFSQEEAVEVHSMLLEQFLLGAESDNIYFS